VILTAGLLVLAGLGLFLAGVLTGTTVFYWICVAVCVLAAVLLVGARRRISRAEAALPTATTGQSVPVVGAPAATPPSSPPSPVTAVSPAVPAQWGQPAGATAAGDTAAATTNGAEAPRHEGGRGAHASREARSPREVTPESLADPPIEDVEVTDLLMIVDLKEEVLVVDEHPRYHLAGCRFLTGRAGVALPVDEARVDGFTPCALCAPDRNLADRERARRAGRTDR
jgi:hypothetical protein